MYMEVLRIWVEWVTKIIKEILPGADSVKILLAPSVFDGAFFYQKPLLFYKAMLFRFIKQVKCKLKRGEKRNPDPFGDNPFIIL